MVSMTDKIADQLVKMRSLNLITEKNFDFISRIKQLGKIPEGAHLLTLDVSSLYTNIPNQEGMLEVADHLRSDPERSKK